MRESPPAIHRPSSSGIARQASTPSGFGACKWISSGPRLRSAANKQGAIAGMIAGFMTALILLVIGRNWGIYILGVKEIGAGVFGVPVGFIVIWVVSLMYPPPDQQTQDLVEEVRYPKGTTMKLAGIE